MSISISISQINKTLILVLRISKMFYAKRQQFTLSAYLMTVASVIVNLNEFMTGVGHGWIAPTMVSLQHGSLGFPVSLQDISWLASLHEISHAIGPTLSLILLDRIGRKYCVIISSFLMFLAWLLTIFTNSILLLYIARLTFGFAVSISEFTAPIYMAENSTPSIRGMICSFYPLFYYAGVSIEFIVATYLPYRSVAVVNTIFAFVALLTVFQLKETPYYLMMKERKEAAVKTLTWLNGHNLDKREIEAEIEKINQNIQIEKLKKKSYKTLLSSPENYKTLLNVVIITMLLVLTGYYAIVSYASTIFLSSSICTSNEFTILLGLVQFVGACISPCILDRFDRRPLLVISFLIIGLNHTIVFILYRTELAYQHNIYFPWLIFASVAMYSFIVALVYPAAFIIRGELLPISVKAIGGFLTVAAESLTAFATIQLFPIITNQCGMEFNFLLYGIASILQCVYIYCTLLETRGKSLVDIQESLKET